MNAPVIWLGIPLVIAVSMWLYKRARWFTAALGAVVCFIFFLLSKFLPIGQTIFLGKRMYEISPQWIILGRRFIIDDSQRAILALIFALGIFWLLVSGFVKVTPLFTPLGLASLVLWLAALSVRPFLYAGLIVEILILLTTPMLVQPGKPPQQGVLRYLIYQTLSVPCLLFAGWVASGVEANPADVDLVNQTVVLLGLGLALLLAVFPFYSWLPRLAEEADPFVVGFLLSIQPVVIMLFALDLLNSFAWLHDFIEFRFVLIGLGALMTLLGSIWITSQENLGRMLGYLVLFENGVCLMILGIPGQIGIELLWMSLFPRLINLGLFSLALKIFQDNGVQTDLRNIEGMIHQYPLTCAALILSLLSCAGAPVLAGFPARQILLENLAARSITASLALIAASLGLLLGAFRLFGIFGIMKFTYWRIKESKRQIFWLVFFILIILITGIAPRIIYPDFLDIIQAFPNIG